MPNYFNYEQMKRQMLAESVAKTARIQRDRINRQLQEFTKAGELSDEQLVETFVTYVLNGLPMGSREEALAEELVDRFSAVVGIKVEDDGN